MLHQDVTDKAGRARGARAGGAPGAAALRAVPYSYVTSLFP